MQRPQGWASRPLGSMCKVTLSQPWVPILSPLSPWQKSQPPPPVLGEPPALQVPRPPRPGLPHSPPGPTYHPPAGVSWTPCPLPLAHASPATAHVCPQSPLCPRCPGPASRPHPGHGALSHSLSPGSHCPQASGGAHWELTEGCAGASGHSRQLGLPRLHPTPGPHLDMSQA